MSSPSPPICPIHDELKVLKLFKQFYPNKPIPPYISDIKGLSIGPYHAVLVYPCDDCKMD